MKSLPNILKATSLKHGSSKSLDAQKSHLAHIQNNAKLTTVTTTTTTKTTTLTTSTAQSSGDSANSHVQDFSSIFKVSEGAQTEMSTGTDIHNMFLQVDQLHSEFQDCQRQLNAELKSGMEARFQDMYARVTEKIKFVEQQYQQGLSRSRLAFHAQLDSAVAQALNQQKKHFQSIIIDHKQKLLSDEQEMARLQVTQKKDLQRTQDKVEKLQYVLRKALIMLRLQGVKDLDGLEVLDDGVETRIGGYLEQLQNQTRRLEEEVCSLKHKLEDALINKKLPLGTEQKASSGSSAAIKTRIGTPAGKVVHASRPGTGSWEAQASSNSLVKGGVTASSNSFATRQGTATEAAGATQHRFMHSETKASAETFSEESSQSPDVSAKEASTSTSNLNFSVQVEKPEKVISIDEHEIELKTLQLEHMRDLKFLKDEIKATHEYYKQQLTEQEKKTQEMQHGYEMRLHAYQVVSNAFPAPHNGTAESNSKAVRDKNVPQQVSSFNSFPDSKLGVKELMATQEKMLHYAAILFGDKSKRSIMTQTTATPFPRPDSSSDTNSNSTDSSSFTELS